MNLTKLALGTASATAVTAVTAPKAIGAVVIFDINPDYVAEVQGYSWDGIAIASLNFSNGTYTLGAGNSLGDVSRYGEGAALFSVGTYGSSLVFNGALPFSDVNVASDASQGMELFATSQVVGANLTWMPNLGKPSGNIAGGAGVGYLGLRLVDPVNGFDYRYGWMEVSFSGITIADGVSYRDYTFTRFAFNDVANASITTPAAVPEASTLGLVGGLFGLVAAAHVRRRKAKQAAASDKFLALAAGEKLN